MALAGLRERWTDPETQQEMLFVTIIVGAASQWMRKYHDRMPMMLNPKDFDAWLNGSSGLEVLKPAPEDALREWPVSKSVNKSGQGDDDPMLKNPAGRYIQASEFGTDVSGQFFASAKGKFSGPMEVQRQPHLHDRGNQKFAWQAVVNISGVDLSSAPSLSAAS